MWALTILPANNHNYLLGNFSYFLQSFSLNLIILDSEDFFISHS